jgi:ATP/maltotriose-dependent transcriptional regulator MalT
VPQLAAKLAAPELQSPVLRADQLERVAHAAGVRLLLVRAPAGYGKTTLVAAAAAELGWKYLWYRLDPLDADPHSFVAALGRAWGPRVPDSGDARPDPPATTARPPIAEAAARLAAELERDLDGELFLVLDGYEALADEAAFNEALAALLAYLPAAVHLVLLSRVRPAFPTARLALEGALAEIDFEELRFDRAQVAEVVGRHAGAPAAPAVVEALLELNEGWPAGVLLAAKASGRLDPGTLDESLDGGELERAVYPYLAEQVYARQSTEAQAFLKQSCCLDSLTTALAEAVTGAPDAGQLLAQLEAEGAFTFAVATGGAYRVHPLLRRFLQDEVAAEGGRAALAALRVRTAAVLAAQGLAAQAVALYLDAGDRQATVAVLREQGYRMLEDCPRPLLPRWTAALGAASADLLGWATLLEGYQHFVTGDLGAARRRLEAALALLADEARGRHLTLRALSKCCSVAGADADSVAYGRQAVEASEGADRAHALRALAEVLAISCRWQELDEVQAAFADCGPVPGELAADMVLTGVRRVYAGGDVRGALTAGELALPTIRRDASGAMLGSLLTGLASLNLSACRYAKGARFLEEAHRVLSVRGPLFARAQVDVMQAAYLAQQGHLRECLNLLDDLAADPLMETNGGILCNVHLVAATTLRRAGEPARAVQRCLRAAQLAPAEVSAYDRLAAQVDLAFAEGLCGAPRHAVARLRLLGDEAEDLGLRFHVAVAGFFVGVLLLRAGEDGLADLVRSGAELLRLGHLDFLGQELVADPAASVWLCAEVVPDEDLRELLRVTALQVGGSALVASLAGRDERILTLLLSLARTDLPARQATTLLQALRRNPTKAVRDQARRLDLGTDASTARLFLELTPREEEILALLAEGCSNEEVARRLVLAVGTVKTHVHRILAKTDSGGRLAAAMLYRRRAAAAGGDGDEQSGQ